MPYFGIPIRNGVPIGLGSVAGFGIAPEFSPSELFTGGVQGAWYDPSDATTLFSDRAGTAPCAAPGAGALVPVGLMLDKSQGLTLGPELVTPAANRDFSSDTGYWTKSSAAITITGGQAVYTSAGSLNGIYRTGFTAAGTYYEITFTIGSISAGALRIYAGGNRTVNVTTAGTYTQKVMAGNVDTLLIFECFGTTTLTLDDVSVKVVSGNHAIAANDTTARPELSARVNLLTYSEQFDNAAWVRTQFNVTANAALAPDGTQTADLLTPASSATSSFVIQSTAATSGQIRLSYYAKQNTGRYFIVVRGPYASYDYAVFDLQSGTVTLQPSFVGSSATISPANNGYYRCTLISSQATGTQAFSISDSASGLGSGTGGSVFLWGADLRPANIGTTIPAYQRVADQYTYDTVGFPRYLAFNGTSSAMSTPANVNLSGTDKATVFAGVRKLGTGTMLIFELSADSSANNGSFSSYVVTPATQYAYASKGTTAFAPATTGAAAYTAPVSNVLTGISDISGDSVILRLNGAQIATNTADQGSGNYGTYPLFIGSRNNASFFLNGDIYSLIVVGSAVSAGNITATETWVNGKTGGVY